MPDQPEGKFRDRVEDSEGGLTREDGRRRPSTGGIEFTPLEDMADAVAGFMPIADRLEPEGDFGGESDAESMDDFGVGLLVAQQKSDKCRMLLERAQKLIASGDWRGALATADEAVAADSTSGEAWALKGRCLAEMGHHEAGLRVLRHARGLVADGDLRVMVLRLESGCIRAITRGLEEKLVKLVEARELERALEVVGEGLRQQPSSIVLLHHLANLHWMRGDTESARRAVEEARHFVGRENVDLIAELERRFTFGPHKADVEAARLMLRQHDAKGAVERLDACRSLEGNEHYDGLREYALQKRGGLSRMMGAAGPVVPQAASRQQTLRWLLSEELKQGEDSTRSGDTQRARRSYEAAATIDPDCGAVYYGHARAIMAQHRRHAVTVDLAAVEGMLQHALIDAGLEEQVKALRRAVVEAGRRTP